MSTSKDDYRNLQIKHQQKRLPMVNVRLSGNLQLEKRKKNKKGEVCITLDGPWCDFVPISLCKFLNAPADLIFRRYCIALHALSQNIDMMSPKSRKQDEKIKRKLNADFPLFQFSFVATLPTRYQDWVKVDLACFQTC